METTSRPPVGEMDLTWRWSQRRGGGSESAGQAPSPGIRGRYAVRKKPEINERCRVSVAPLGVPRGASLATATSKPCSSKSRRLRLPTHIRQHSDSEDDLGDTALTQLEDEVVGLRTPDPMRTDDDRFPILDLGLETLEPVRPGLGNSHRDSMPRDERTYCRKTRSTPEGR